MNDLTKPVLYLTEMITVSSETTVDASEEPLINDGEVIQNSNVVVVKQT